MKKVIIFLSVLILSPLPLLAQVYIVEVMPNTDDDANMEYIDIVNTGCEAVDISGYQIADKEKSYTFAAGSTLTSHGRYRLGRPTSKIILNNSNEELSLRDSRGTLIHNFSYATSVKGVAITVPGIILDDCEVILPSEDTGTEGEDNNWEGDTTEDVTTQEDIAEEDEVENTTTETDDEIDDIVEDDSTDLLDENGEDIIIDDEDIQIEEEESEADSESTDTGGAGSSTEHTDGDAGVATEDIQTTNLLGKSGSLLPQVLLYSDSDEDGYIDILEVLYDIYITGSVDISKIFLYSNTGGLYDFRVNTATGYILDAEIEDNILRLFIEPSHFLKTQLIVNNTTQSDLRLRTYSPFGVMSLTGASVDGFLLTSSFDSYKQVYTPHQYADILGPPVSEDTRSSMPSAQVSVVFPAIIPTIQHTTNTLFSGHIFTCRESPCRLNLTFDPIFSSSYRSGDYTCRIEYAGSITATCNPPQWTPTGPGSFSIILTHKSSGERRVQIYDIDWDIQQKISAQQQKNTIPDLAAPVALITLNGKLTKRQYQKSDNEILCFTATCSVNFDGSDTYDREGSRMTYEWSSNGIIFSTRKNPVAQIFSAGEYHIEFKAIDTSGNIGIATYTISVLGDIEPPPELNISLAATKSSASKKKKKPIVHFFSPPRLIVEKSTSPLSTLRHGGYRCVVSQASCSINFGLVDTVPGIQYAIRYSHEDAVIWTSNPRSKSLKPGRYTIILSAHYTRDGDAIWSETIPIEIVRVKAPAKKKTTTKKTTTKKTEMIPTANAADDMSDGGIYSIHSGLMFFLFLSLFLNIFLIRRKKS